MFDLGDFDETLPRPFEWDVQRLAASLVVAAREDGLKAATADEAVVTAVEAYRDRTARYAKTSELGPWCDATHVDSMISYFTPADHGRISVHIEKESRSRTHLGAFAKLTSMADGRPRIDEDPPSRVAIDDDEQDALTDQFLTGYRMTSREDKRFLFDRFTPVDVVRQVVGVASVGMRVYLVLLEGRSGSDRLFLQVKQAAPSVYEPYLGRSHHDKTERARPRATRAHHRRGYGRVHPVGRRSFRIACRSLACQFAETSTRSRAVSVNVATKRTAFMSGTNALLTLSTLVLLAACQRADEAVAPEIRPVRVTTIENRSASGSVSLTGTVQAQTEINQSFRIDGRLVERTVDIGDSVKPGQLVARLDPQNEESSLQSVRAQLAAAQAQLVEARTNHGRMRDLVAQDAVPRASFDQAVAVLKTAESQVESVQSQVTLAQNRLNYTRLLSDVAGVVTARGAEPGEVVSVGRMIVQVAREGARDAVFDVPGRIKDVAPKNPQITVVLTDDPRVTVAGQIREVAPRADPVTGTFAVRVRLIDPPPAMRLGSTVTGKMQLPEALAIEVPASALVRADGKTAVWVVDQASSTVSLRNVQLGGGDANTVQVAAGLNPGDVVVIAGVQALRPGQKVRVPEARS